MPSSDTPLPAHYKITATSNPNPTPNPTMTNRQSEMAALNSSTTLPSSSNTIVAKTNDAGLQPTDKDATKQKATITKSTSDGSSKAKSNKQMAVGRKEVPRKKQTTSNKRTYKRRGKADVGSKPGRNTKQSIARPPRRVIPECKDHLYIHETEPNDSDVVSGRGGRSNHHRGNRPYWLRILQLRSEYRQCPDDSSKQLVAQTVVDFVHNHQKGRFLQREAETDRWFVLPPKVVMDKCKQALRDKYVPLWARRELGLETEGSEEDKDGESASDCSKRHVKADCTPSASKKKRSPATPSKSSAQSRPPQKRASKHKHVTNKSTRTPTTKKSPPTQPRTKWRSAITKKIEVIERPPIAKLKPDDDSRSLLPTVAQGDSTIREEQVAYAAAAKLKPEEEDGVRRRPQTAAQGKPPAREEAVEGYDDLKEAIEQKLPSLSFNNGDPVGDFSFGHPMSFGDLNNSRGNLGSAHATEAASGGGGDNNTLVSAALNGSVNVASLDMVGNMVNEWENHQGQQQENTLAPWQRIFDDELRDALMNQPTNFDQV